MNETDARALALLTPQEPRDGIARHAVARAYLFRGLQLRETAPAASRILSRAREAELLDPEPHTGGMPE